MANEIRMVDAWDAEDRKALNAAYDRLKKLPVAEPHYIPLIAAQVLSKWWDEDRPGGRAELGRRLETAFHDRRQEAA